VRKVQLEVLALSDADARDGFTEEAARVGQ
jgi:hypothetical protein